MNTAGNNDDLDLFDSAPSGYLLTEPNGVITRANNTFLSWTGYEATEIVGRRFQDLLTAGGRIFHETHYAPLLRMHGSVREIAVDIVRHDKSIMPALVNSSLSFDSAGNPTVARVSLFEATHRRQYERELVLAKEKAESSEARALELAQVLQESLLPPGPPTMERIEVGTAYRPAGSGDEIGGDFYDFFETSTNEWSVVLGDVAGKGAAAAAVTSAARYAVRAAAITTEDAAGVLRLLNDSLLIGTSDRSCTAIYGRLDIGVDEVIFRFSCGGHATPLLVKPTGEIHSVGTPGGVLGFFPSIDVETSEVALSPGDQLVMFTDGVTDGRRKGEFFGESRVLEFLQAHAGDDANKVAAGLAEMVLDFQDGFARDDIAVVVLRSKV